MLKLFITVGGNRVDYSKYIAWRSASAQEKINVPAQMNFTLIPSDIAFVPPIQRAYVELYSTRWDRNLFTGFVSAEPVKKYLGLAPAQMMMAGPGQGQLLQYDILCTSDDHLLNIKAVPFIPAFINRTQGAILTSIANTLCPALSLKGVVNAQQYGDGIRSLVTWVSGDQFTLAMRGQQIVLYTLGVAYSYIVLNVLDATHLDIDGLVQPQLNTPYSFAGEAFFDTSMIMSGDIVPYYQYDPSQSWSEIAKKFGDGVRYRYKARDKMLWYVPYGDLPLGIEYQEPDIGRAQQTFSPRDLATTVLSVPLVNDVTIIGDTEAGNSRDDYFIGDGFTANFPLKHKVFRGASTLLLKEDWKSNAINLQQWYVNPVGDPQGVFDMTAGALNIITNGIYTNLGDAYLSMNNGLELAGGSDIEHGEFCFNDQCEGVIGGFYTSSLYDAASLLGGFVISTPGGVTTGASGAAGIYIQPWWNNVGLLDASLADNVSPAGTPLSAMSVDGVDGVAIGDPIITEVNHTYVLQTVVTAPKYVRYDRIYRTLEGMEFGGVHNSVSGAVTFLIQDFDISQIVNNPETVGGFYYTPKITSVTIVVADLPSFVAYALANVTSKFNATVGSTLVASMPMGALEADVGPSGLYTPTGAILPMLPPDSGEFIGTVQPWPSTYSGNILADPLTLSGVQQQVLGNGLQLQAAQITQGNEADQLAFYAQTVPAAGTPVHLRTWEAQAAVSRLQDRISIAQEAFVVGDDGIRSAIISDLNPLPRTSEDCDNAAAAFLTDRVNVFYNGTYTITSLSFQGLTSDQQFWPTVGRYLNIHAPKRGINHQKMLVTSLGIQILAEVDEILQFQIGFGADLHLEKVLKNFVDIKPPEVLFPQDKAKPPDPRNVIEYSTSFLPDLDNIYVTDISADQIIVENRDLRGHAIEVRLLDTNWKRLSYDYVGTFFGPTFTLPRSNYDQVWFMRAVTDASGGVVDSPTGVAMTSRRSKAIHVRYPRRPASPAIQGITPVQAVGPSGNLIDSATIQFDYNGDIRSVYGLEVRMSDNRTIIFQQPAFSFAQMYVDLNLTPFPYLKMALAASDPGLSGTAAISGALSEQDFFLAYFFNHQWEYSEAAYVSVSPLPTAGLIGVPIVSWAIGIKEPQDAGSMIANPIIIRRPQPYLITEVVAIPHREYPPTGDVAWDIIRFRNGLSGSIFNNRWVMVPSGMIVPDVDRDLAFTDFQEYDEIYINQSGASIQLATVEIHGY